MTNRYAVILAAGKGTRMKSKLHKMLHSVCGKPMIQHIVDQAFQLSVSDIVTVIGHDAQAVKEQLGNKVQFVLQKEQLGTAHAVMMAEDTLSDKNGTTVVLYGDTPLITEKTIKALFDRHESTNAKATVLTATADDPTGYGRIIRSAEGVVERVVEQKDASREEKKIAEINTGIYCFDNRALFDALKKVDNDNAQGEYYLPDVIEILQGDGETVEAFTTEDFEETLGVNDRVQLSRAEQILQKRINEAHMRNGVTLPDPSSTYISADVTIGQDTVVYPGTHLSGFTLIGSDCEVGPQTEIGNSRIGDRTVIKQSIVTESDVGNQVKIGPYAHIRPQSNIGNQVKVGNFVEVKKSSIGRGSKASHLSYIGDAEIGRDVNLGCGSITVNYDGNNKYLTKIEDGAFIGCNVNLVAPVTVGKSAFVAAGSTITETVPDEALSIARSRQTNKENYVGKQKRREP